jgi:hypothetical protein
MLRQIVATANSRPSRAMSLTVPQTILARVDKVIA